MTPATEIIYVWQIPVRLTHWAVAAALVVLSVTGLYIGNPYVIGGNFLMLYVKQWHLVFAVVLSCAVAARIAWLFLGNRWSNWRGFVPFATPAWASRCIDVLLFYVFAHRRSPRTVGHNPLAALTYVLVYALLFFEIFSGFALNSLNWGGWWSVVFGWVFRFFPANDVRLMHHMSMWLLLGFLVHHVYSASLMDFAERSGIVSSIFTGYKFVRRKS